MKKIIILDDEVQILKSLKRSLVREGWDVLAFDDPEVALSYARTGFFSVAISDYKMPAMDGVDFLRAFKKLQPLCSTIMLSGQADHEGMSRAINYSVVDHFMDKPWSERSLLDQVDKAKNLFVRKLAIQRKANKSAMSKEEYKNWHEQLLEKVDPGITRVCKNEMGWIELEK
mgnify:CR=1 FL=1